MNKEVWVIERFLAPGIWELANPTFYSDEKSALDDCIEWVKTMQKIDKDATARVTKLITYKEYEKRNREIS